MSPTSPRGTSKTTGAGGRSPAWPEWGRGANSPPRHAGRSASSRSELAGWGEPSFCKGLGIGSGRGAPTRLPATRGGRPARAASSPGGRHGEWARGANSPPRHAGRSASSRSELAGWGDTSFAKVHEEGWILELAHDRELVAIPP